MSETPLVSICCITYNHASFIRQCLDGFLMQKTSFPFEILIHDDASTDGTADIIREYQKKYPDIIKPILQKENQFSKGIMVGAEYNYPRACGKYIAVCEGDDYWTDPEKLQIQFDYMEKHPECSLCYHDYKILENGCFHDTDFGIGGEQDISVSDDFYCTTCTLFFRNIDHSEYLCSVLRNGRGRIKGGDVFIMGCMHHFGKLHWMPAAMAVYRNHPGGITKNKNWVDNKLTWVTHWLYFEKVVPDARPMTRRHLLKQIKNELIKIVFLKENIAKDIFRTISENRGLSFAIYIYITAVISGLLRFPRFLFRKIFRIK